MEDTLWGEAKVALSREWAFYSEAEQLQLLKRLVEYVDSIRTDQKTEAQQQLDRIEAKLDLLLAKKKPVQRKPVSECTEFDAFWKVYPIKKGKKAAQRAFSGIPKGIRQLILEDIWERIHEDSGWIDGYCPHPATYLNGARWEDEITPVTVKAETMPKDDNQLQTWASGKDMRTARPGESMAQYRQALQQLYRSN